MQAKITPLRSATFIAALLAAAPLHADTFTWSGFTTGSGNFNSSFNWIPIIGGPPGANDVAVFPELGVFPVYSITFTTNVTNQQAQISAPDVNFNLQGFTYTLTDVSETNPGLSVGLGGGPPS